MRNEATTLQPNELFRVRNKGAFVVGLLIALAFINYLCVHVFGSRPWVFCGGLWLVDKMQLAALHGYVALAGAVFFMFVMFTKGGVAAFKAAIIYGLIYLIPLWAGTILSMGGTCPGQTMPAALQIPPLTPITSTPMAIPAEPTVIAPAPKAHPLPPRRPASLDLKTNTAPDSDPMEEFYARAARASH